MVGEPEKVIAYYLVTGSGTGLTWPPDDGSDPTDGAWTCTYGEMPEESRLRWVGVFRTGGRVNSRQMKGPQNDLYEIQVRFRAENDDVARAKAKAVAAALEAVYQFVVTVEGTGYTINHFSRRNGPTFLKEEERYKMRNFVLNGFTLIT